VQCGPPVPASDTFTASAFIAGHVVAVQTAALDSFGDISIDTKLI